MVPASLHPRLLGQTCLTLVSPLDVKSRLWSMNEAVSSCQSGANTITILLASNFPAKKYRKIRRCLIRYATLVPELVWLKARRQSRDGLAEVGLGWGAHSGRIVCGVACVFAEICERISRRERLLSATREGRVAAQRVSSVL